MNTVVAVMSELTKTASGSKSIGTVSPVNGTPWHSLAMTGTLLATLNTAAAANRMVSTLRTTLCFMIFLLPLAECLLHPELLLPGACLALRSNVECNAWTLRGHYKSEPHSHRALTV